jgi:SAM-dependent methyltransferase
MSDSETGAASPASRGAWLRDRRRVDEQQEDALAGDYDAQWGEIEPTHQGFVERFLSRLPPAGRVLDAACGTGKYFPMVLASGRSLLGTDHAGASLAIAAAKFPQVPTEQHDLQELPYQDQFHGVLCVDAMEFVPPEDWPVVLERFCRALRSGGWLYLTVERAPADRVRAANQAARRSGLPVWWTARSSGTSPTATTITTRACRRSGRGWVVPGSPSRRRSGVPGTRRGTPTTTCWPAWQLRQGEDARSAIVIGGSTWLGRGWLTAHYFTLYGRARPAETQGCIAVSPRLLIRMRSQVQVLAGPPTSSDQRKRRPFFLDPADFYASLVSDERRRVPPLSLSPYAA